MPECWLLMVVNVQVQKGHYASMLVTTGGGGPIPECLIAKRSLSLNVGY